MRICRTYPQGPCDGLQPIFTTSIPQATSSFAAWRLCEPHRGGEAVAAGPKHPHARKVVPTLPHRDAGHPPHNPAGPSSMGLPTHATAISQSPSNSNIFSTNSPPRYWCSGAADPQDGGLRPSPSKHMFAPRRILHFSPLRLHMPPIRTPHPVWHHFQLNSQHQHHCHIHSPHQPCGNTNSAARSSFPSTTYQPTDL